MPPRNRRPRKATRVVSVPGVPDVPPGGADLEWSKKWRGSIYGTIDQQKLVARACLVEELPPSPAKVQLKPDPGRALLATPLAAVEEEEGGGGGGGGVSKATLDARALLRRLGEMNAMRNEDDLAAALRDQQRAELARREQFAVGASDAQARTMAVGDPRWRRRIQHLIAFAERHGLTLRRCFDVAERLRAREDAALAADARDRHRKAMLWGGGQQQLLQYDGKGDPASLLREKQKLVAAEQVFEFRGFCAILGVSPPGAQDKQLFDLFDSRGLGLVDLQAFLLVLLQTTSAAPREKQRLVFHIIDRDQNGTLDIGELQLILKCNWQANDWEIEKKARAILAASDADGSGELDFNEFSAYVDEHPDVFLPAFIRQANAARAKEKRKEVSAAVLEGVQDPALLAKSGGGKKKSRGGGSRGGRGRGRGRGQGRGRGGRGRAPRAQCTWPLPALRVRKIVELSHGHKDALHVQLPPFRRMVEDNSILDWGVKFGFGVSGNPEVTMVNVSAGSGSRGSSRGTGVS